MIYYLQFYFFGSFLGYVIETCLQYFFFPSMNNGILYGPWIPVYGFGILLILIIVDRISSLSCSKKVKWLLSFFFFFFLLTFLEEISGLLIEFVFHKKFWSYQQLPFHVGPYISLEMSFLWSFVGLLFTRYVRPFVELFLKKIPIVFTIGILILHIMDILFTWLV